MPEFFDAWLQSCRRAWRATLKAPRFLLVGSFTLGIAIAAVVTVFCWIDAFMLAPLPFPQSGNLMAIGQSGEADSLSGLTPEEYQALGSDALGAASAIVRRAGLVQEQHRQTLSTLAVDRGFLQTLDPPLVLGRNFLAGEDQPGAIQAVIISHEIWQSQFDHAPDVIGRRVQVDGQSVSVVGVLPEAFRWLERIDMLTPLALPDHSDDRGRNLVVIARKDAHGSGAASLSLAEIQTRLDRLNASNGSDEQHLRYAQKPLAEFLAGTSSRQLLLFLGGAGCALLVALFNLINLFLQRLLARRSELAIQRALGAPTRRLVGDILAESSMLALAASVLGLSLAVFLVQRSVPWLPADWGYTLPRLNTRSVFVGVVCALLASAAAALFALWRTMRRYPASDIVSSGQLGQSRRGSRVGTSLMIGQTALALALLCVALQVRDSLVRLNAIALGFEPAQVLRFSLNAQRTQYPNGSNLQSLLTRLASDLPKVPGVSSVAIAPALPIGEGLNLPVFVGERSTPSSVEVRFVAGDYFGTYGIPIEDGKAFSGDDRLGSEPVAIVSRAFLEEFPQDARLGGQVRFLLDGIPDLAGMSNSPMRITGIAADVRQFGPQNPSLATLYLPLAQSDPLLLQLVRGFRPWKFALKIDGPTGEFQPALQDALARLLPAQPVDEIGTLQDSVDEATRDQRLYLWLSGSLAFAALCLALTGLYSVLGADLAQRQREFGLRSAIGATPRQLAASVLGHVISRTAIGCAIGIALSLYMSVLLRQRLEGLSAPQMSTIVLISGAFLLLALLSGLEAALRAARTRPAACL